MASKKQNILQLSIAVIGVFLCVYGISILNQQHILKGLSLPLRIPALIVVQWLIFLVPGILMIMNKESLRSLGFSKNKIVQQIGIGIVLACGMSLVLTVLPILLGYKEMIGSTNYTMTWQFVFQFFYSVCGVSLAEELVFRGYLFQKLLQLKDSRWLAIVVSSLIFGLFHIFNGNLIQVFVTAIIGFILCLFREKIKGTTLLSLILAHGLYDALIVVWVAVL